MGCAHIGEVERCVYFGCGHRRQHGIDFHHLAARFLPDHVSGIFIGFLLHMPEIERLEPWSLQAFLITMEHDVPIRRSVGGDESGLLEVADIFGMLAGFDAAGEFGHCAFPHTVDYHIHRSIEQNGWAQAVFPIVIMRHSSKRCLDASGNHRHIGKEILENLGIYDCGIVGAHAVASAGCVSVVVAQPSGSGVMVHHRVHSAGRHAEEEARLAEFAEVAEVVAPVGLRHDSHPVTGLLERPSNHCGTKGGMVHIGIA